jgi:NTP pyrophosphatase (non-canonical NTP hydrolase)
MNATEYKKRALGVERQDHAPVVERLSAPGVTRLLHGALGLGTESAEVEDVLKRHAFYGTPIDKVNLKEELGDVMWYIAIIADEIGITIEEIMATNIAKLESRYAKGFAENKAVARDLTAERKILEGNNGQERT